MFDGAAAVADGHDQPDTEVGGTQRSYQLTMPRSAQQARAGSVTLVIGLHGGIGSGSQFASTTRSPALTVTIGKVAIVGHSNGAMPAWRSACESPAWPRQTGRSPGPSRVPKGAPRPRVPPCWGFTATRVRTTRSAVAQVPGASPVSNIVRWPRRSGVQAFRSKIRSALVRRNLGHTSSLNPTLGSSEKMRS